MLIIIGYVIMLGIYTFPLMINNSYESETNELSHVEYLSSATDSGYLRIILVLKREQKKLTH